MKDFIHESRNGLRIIWRVFLLCFFVSFIYQLGKIGALFAADVIESQLVGDVILGVYVLLCILLFPYIVSGVAESVDLKAETYDRTFLKRMKARQRARREAQD